MLVPLLVPCLELLRMSLRGKDQLVFTAVPVSLVRYFSRGFNQSSLLAKTLIKTEGGIYRPTLFRVPSIRHQAHLSYEERIKNVQSAFFPYPLSSRKIS